MPLNKTLYYDQVKQVVGYDRHIIYMYEYKFSTII